MSRKRRKPTGEAEEKNQNFTKLINHRVFAPTEIGNLRKISDSAIRILSEIGMSDAPKELCDLILEYGGKLEGKRLLYPTNLIESTIKRHQRVILLAGQTADNDLQVGGNYVYAGTGGAAPNLQNHKTKQYVPPKLKDLYDAARLADKLPNISFFSRSLVALSMSWFKLPISLT